MKKQIVGWTQPPHPFNVTPPFDPNASDDAQSQAVILDLLHDDDLRNWASSWRFPFAGGKFNNDTHVEDTDPFAVWVFYKTNGQVTPFALSADVNYDVNASLSALRDAVQKAKAKRAALPPLPANNYGDPITIYYYDNDRMKRVFYPVASLGKAAPGDGMALDPKNIYWWKGNNIQTQQLNSDGTWGDEGFDWNKDVAGNVGAITSAILGAIGTVLVLTGVGAAAGAALIAITPALAAYANVIDTAFQGGDLNKALGGFLKAVQGMIAAGQWPAGLTKDLVKTAGAQLQRLQSLLSSPGMQGLNFSDSYAKIQAQLGSIGLVTDEQVFALAQMLGPSAGRVLTAGYEAATYADAATLDGVSSILPDPDAQNIFKLGAYLGSIRQDQLATGVQGPLPVWAAQGTFQLPLQLQTTIPLTPMQDLVNYVTGVLKPRDHL